MLTTRVATEDDMEYLADTFIRAMRTHITAARGFWNEAMEQTQFPNSFGFTTHASLSMIAVIRQVIDDARARGAVSPSRS